VATTVHIDGFAERLKELCVEYYAVSERYKGMKDRMEFKFRTIFLTTTHGWNGKQMRRRTLWMPTPWRTGNEIRRIGF